MSVSDYDDVMIEDEDDEMIIGDEVLNPLSEEGFQHVPQNYRHHSKYY